MKTETLVQAMHQLRDSSASLVQTRVVEGDRVFDLTVSTVLLLAAEQLVRSDIAYIPLYRRLVQQMQAKNYDLLYERLMGEEIPKELQQ